MNLEFQLTREFERMAAVERPSPALWERVRARTVMKSSPRTFWRTGALRLALALSLVLGVGYLVLARQQAFRNLLTTSSVPGDPTDRAGRPGTSLIVPRTSTSGLPLSAQFFGIAGRKRGDMLGCVDLPLGQAPGIALEAPVQTPIHAVQGSSVSGSADLWPGPNGERLVSANVQISKLDELPARTDGSRLLVWHLTRGTCAEWSPAAPPLTKDALVVPTAGTGRFTLLQPSNVPSDAVGSLQ